MKQIELTQGKFAIVDDDDFHYLSRFNWTLFIDKYGNENVHRVLQTRFRNAQIGLEDYIIPRHSTGGKQRLVFKNENRLDFRKENLFFVHENTVQNRAKKAKTYMGRAPCSTYKGVTKNNKFNPDGTTRGKSWRVQIESGKRNTPNHKIFVALRDTEKECAILYNQKALEFHGEFAYQNIIKY